MLVSHSSILFCLVGKSNKKRSDQFLACETFTDYYFSSTKCTQLLRLANLWFCNFVICTVAIDVNKPSSSDHMTKSTSQVSTPTWETISTTKTRQFRPSQLKIKISISQPIFHPVFCSGRWFIQDNTRTNISQHFWWWECPIHTQHVWHWSINWNNYSDDYQYSNNSRDDTRIIPVMGRWKLWSRG